jgi:hypothetical protein
MASVPNSAPNVITAAGAVTPAKFNAINAAGALALTLAAPVADGAEIYFNDETGHAHTITATGLFNGGKSGMANELTFGGTVGNCAMLVSRNGYWWLLASAGITAS